jgi:tRNA/rRNA methyltransferase
MSLQNCRVVLVRPQIAANVGAVARVMRNMGLRDLALVEPLANPADPVARKLSTQGEEILQRARIVADLGESIKDCVLVAGTSARIGGPFRRQSVGAPEAIIPLLVEEIAKSPVALVFGPEPSGLTDVEVTRCHYLIHISADPDYPALNLAQAVAICLYELRRAWLKQTAPATSLSEAAPFEMQERMFANLRSALEDIHFLYGQSADSLMHALRHLIGRAKPTATEVDILLGLARQIRWYADHRGEPKRDALSS